MSASSTDSSTGVIEQARPRTLRERCAFDRTLSFDRPYGYYGERKSPINNTQPHRTKLPRLPRNLRMKVVFTVQEEDPGPPSPSASPSPSSSPSPSPSPSLPELCSSDSEEPSSPCTYPAAFDHLAPQAPSTSAAQLQELLPGISVAFGAYEDHRKGGFAFTHVVEIAYGTKAAGQHLHIQDGRTQRLRLVLPQKARRWECRPPLALNDDQLRAARGFVQDALPQDVVEKGEQEMVRVLITTPPGRPTDAMAIVASYLAYVADKDVQSILDFIDEEDDILSVWKYEVSGQEVERLELLARS